MGKKSGRMMAIVGWLMVATIVCIFGMARAENNSLQKAPLNPDFLKWREEKAATGENYGFVPPPIRPLPTPATEETLPETLPARYDLRDPNGDGDNSDSKLTPVKDQGGCGACWAFATYGSLESKLKSEYSITYDFSEDNLKHRHGFDFGPCNGGNWFMSMAYLTRNDGPIYEEDDPYDPASSSDYCTSCSPPFYIGNMRVLGASSRDYIKGRIYQNGALYTSMHWENSAYDDSTNTYLYKGSDPNNHAVVLVGWDDNKVVPGATSPGAWIVRNSWSSWWGEGGYFYISYEDASLGKNGYGFFEVDWDWNHGHSLPRTAKIYYYDELGVVSSMGVGGSDTLWGANRFVAEKNGQINAVGFYAVAPNTSYEIRVYKGGFSGTVVSTQTGSLETAGWYTIEILPSVSVKAGEEFIVAVKFTTPGYQYPVPIESPVSGYSSSASASPGESYYSTDGNTWTDITSETGFENTNICIKALSFKPIKAVLGHPEGTINDRTPTFNWWGDKSSWFYLWINDSSGHPLFRKWYKEESICISPILPGGVLCKITPPKEFSDGNYRWWVRSWNENGYGPWSSPKSFTVNTGASPPGKAFPAEPTETITTNKPTYRWDEVGAASWYYLWVNDASGHPVFKKWYKAWSVCEDSSCSVTPDNVVLADGKYRWWLRTWNKDGYGPWSSGRWFTVDTSGRPGSVHLVSPSGTIDENTPTYTWEPDSLATWYYLWINDASNHLVFRKWYKSSEICGGFISWNCHVTPPKELENGGYRWWVRPWNDVGYGPWSSGMTFTVDVE